MKKSKIWNDKNYKRMQTIFESQGIKANFDSLNVNEVSSFINEGSVKTIEDAIARFARVNSALESDTLNIDPATREEMEVVLIRDILGPAMPMLRKAGIKAGESMEDTKEWLAAEAADMTARPDLLDRK
jgi:hypothetical protein